MSMAARIRLRKLEAMASADAIATAQRETAAAAAEARRAERLAQPFDHDSSVQIANVDAATTSPAAILRQQKLARLEIEQNGAAGLAAERSETGEGATEYELLLAALGEDEAALKRIQGTERKEAMKRGLIGKFDPHVDATLAAAADTGTAVQDEIVAMMMIWRFDIGDFDRALDLAEHMLRHGLRLPVIKNFSRTPATIVCDIVADAALLADKQSKDFDLFILHRAAQLTADFDMPDQVRAKMAKATALHMLRQAEYADGDPEAVETGKNIEARSVALDLLRRALELDKGSGVIKHLERTESWLKKNVIITGDEGASQAPSAATPATEAKE